MLGALRPDVELGLAGKVALVTGASRGIGAAIAEELAREGVNLCLVARHQADLHQTASAIRDKVGRAIHAQAVDLRDRDVPKRVVDDAIAEFGHLDILVNCAGDTRSKAFLDATDDDWQDAFEVKFHGAVRLSRTAWPHLKSRGGCIVNIVGNTARSGRAELCINGAVNAALLNLTKALSDMGRRDGIRVNAINPGRTATRRLDRALDRLVDESGITRAEATKRLLEAAGIRRFGEPREIGWLAAYLASSRADFIQGAIVDIDGGETRAL